MYSFSAEEVINNYSDMVYRIAISHTKQVQDAEDVFQEVFLRLIRFQNRIESEEHLKAWLIRVALNCCKDLFKQPWNKRVVLMNEDLGAALTMQHEDDIIYLVRALKEPYRTAIHLFYYEDMPIRAIADIMGQNESATKSQLSRGRKMLEKMLKVEELRNERTV